MWREKIKSILSWQKGREAKGRAEKKEFPELRGKQDKKELFQKAILQESRKAIQNPGCGWYHLYTFNAAQTRMHAFPRSPSMHNSWNLHNFKIKKQHLSNHISIRIFIIEMIIFGIV